MRPAPQGPGWVTAAARRWAAASGRPAVEVAHLVADHVTRHPDVATAAVLGDGMLHVVLTPRASGAVVAAVLGSRAPGWGALGEGDSGGAPDGEDEHTGQDRQRLPGPRPALPGPGGRRRGHPVFSVLWAHSRAAAVAGVAQGLGVEATPRVGDLLCVPTEDALLTALAAFPDDVAGAVDRAAFLPRLVDLSGRTHTWLDDDVVVPRATSDPVEPVHQARVALATATARVLATGLDLLGLPAPTRV